MQAELLGAHAMGLRNLLIVTGEPLRRGDYPDATTVFEVDSIGLTNAVTRFNQALTSAVRRSAGRQRFTPACASTPRRWRSTRKCGATGTRWRPARSSP